MSPQTNGAGSDEPDGDHDDGGLSEPMDVDEGAGSLGDRCPMVDFAPRGGDAAAESAPCSSAPTAETGRRSSEPVCGLWPSGDARACARRRSYPAAPFKAGVAPTLEPIFTIARRARPLNRDGTPVYGVEDDEPRIDADLSSPRPR